MEDDSIDMEGDLKMTASIWKMTVSIWDVMSLCAPPHHDLHPFVAVAPAQLTLLIVCSLRGNQTERNHVRRIELKVGGKLEHVILATVE